MLLKDCLTLTFYSCFKHIPEMSRVIFRYGCVHTILFYFAKKIKLGDRGIDPVILDYKGAVETAAASNFRNFFL